MDVQFVDFKWRFNAFMGLAENSNECHDFIEVLFDIVEGQSDYDFDFEELRLSPLLVMSAVLLSKWKGKRVVFVCPTSYYSAQALRFARGFADHDTLRNISICPSAHITDELAKATDVFLHHGRQYPLPASASGKRQVIQYFAGEKVPNDSRSLASLLMRE